MKTRTCFKFQFKALAAWLGGITQGEVLRRRAQPPSCLKRSLPCRRFKGGFAFSRLVAAVALGQTLHKRADKWKGLFRAGAAGTNSLPTLDCLSYICSSRAFGHGLHPPGGGGGGLFHSHYHHHNSTIAEPDTSLRVAVALTNVIGVARGARDASR